MQTLSTIKGLSHDIRQLIPKFGLDTGRAGILAGATAPTTAGTIYGMVLELVQADLTAGDQGFDMGLEQARVDGGHQLDGLLFDGWNRLELSQWTSTA